MTKVFTIKKLKMIKGKYSAISEGFNRSGTRIGLYDSGTETSIDNVHQVTPGSQFVLFSGFGILMNTSVINDVLAVDENTIMFTTQTSIYELTQVEEV